MHELLPIVFRSLQVTGLALMLATAMGVPLGAGVGLHRFPGRGAIIAALYTGMGLPPVVVGLAVYLLISREGPLGPLGWLFTAQAMVLAQTVIALPVVAALSAAAVQTVPSELRLQLRSLGTTPWRETGLILREARVGIVAAVVAGFGSIISEVGAVMLVGGNVQGQTRVLTTAIVLETQRGNFLVALELGAVLLGITLTGTIALLRLQGRFGES